VSELDRIGRNGDKEGYHRLSPGSRRKLIIDLVKEKEVLQVNDLMALFNISRATMMRDLTFLQEKGLINKTYGAIVNRESVSPRTEAYSFDASLHENISEKRAIARAAFPLIANNSSLVLNSGVTTLEVARLISESKMRLNIITNSLQVANVLSHDVLRNVLLLGGDLAHGGNKVTGRLTCENIATIQADIAFLGVHDIDPETGITMPFSTEAELIAAIIKRCRKRVILADYSKFGRMSLYKVDCSFSDISLIITDSRIAEQYVSRFREKGVEVMIAGMKT
jgi:DeoR family fructose operon transcriptional repressor